MDSLWPWLTLAALGAYHGLNPAMGWLFAVSRGMQERSRKAVTRSLLPILAGHEAAVLVGAAIVLVAAEVVDDGALRIAAAAALFAFGIFRFVKPRWHPRWTTMRVNGRELAWWSFLMSSAHGAGLIVAPVLIGAGADAQAAGGHAHAPEASGSLLLDAAGLALHAGVMLLVMGLVAVLVYEKLGVKVLRKAWLNTDQLWAAAFVLAAGITLFT